jgi:hypothetical protein
MRTRRAVTRTLASVMLAAAGLLLTNNLAWAAPAPPPPPHPKLAPVSAQDCTTGHGQIVSAPNKKGVVKKHCKGGTLNGRKVAP